MDELQEKYTLLVAQNEVLRKENAELKSLLCAHGIQYKLKSSEEVAPVYSSISLPTINLSLDERVTLFMSLFKGREDVFARRWFSKATGNGGYQPVCGLTRKSVGVCVDICKSEQETQHTSSIHYIGQPQLPVRSAQFQLVSAANHFVAFLCSTLGNASASSLHGRLQDCHFA